MSFFRPHAAFPVAPGVEGFRSVLVNYYFVTSPHEDGWVLIDAGLSVSGPRLLAAARRRFGPVRPKAILLTHGHFDHVGALARLARHWTTPLYAHERELPFINDGLQYPPPDPSVGGGLIARSSVLFPRRVRALPTMVRALPDDGTVPGLPDWKWISTPGHSPGHVSFWRGDDRLLIAGDAVVSTRQESAIAVWTQRREVRPPPAYFTPNWRLAFDSLERLRALRPEILASGHGQPVRGAGLQRGLDRLVDEFDTRGLPKHGHYVRATWMPT